MNEKYTNSLIDSTINYLYNLRYLASDDKITLRALNTYKMLLQVYNWADWFEVSEQDKKKIENLINCVILRNSNIVLPTINSNSNYYSNVNTPQTIHTWQKVYNSLTPEND